MDGGVDPDGISLNTRLGNLWEQVMYDWNATLLPLWKLSVGIVRTIQWMKCSQVPLSAGKDMTIVVTISLPKAEVKVISQEITIQEKKFHL